MAVGMPGSLPRVRTHAVVGTYTASEALAIMLEGTGLEAVRLGDTTFRLQRASVAARPSAPARGARAPELDEVIVTGAKRGQSLRTVPNSIQVFAGDSLANTVAPDGSATAALLDVTTSSTNLGPGRDRQFIRGVADSAFLGPSQATVSIQFDEARATFDGPDPDLRLLDIEQVEVLKGPQGPLYGSGALGGVYHIVPRRPDLWRNDLRAAVHTTSVAQGELAGGADLMWNVVPVPGRLALRGVAYALRDPGWINNTDGRINANATDTRGARLALAAALPADWTLDVQGVAQLMSTDDSQYLLTSGDSLQRSGVLPEPRDNDFYLGAVTARGKIFGHDALVTVNGVHHEANAMLDASAAAGVWGESAPLRYNDRRHYRIANQEARIWSSGEGRMDWLVGVSRLVSTSNSTGLLEPEAVAAREVLSLVERVHETALFGELSVPVAGGWHATPGLRLFRNSVRNASAGAEGDPDLQRNAVQTSLTPSFSLDWQAPDEGRFYYLRYARAIRAGGLNPAGSAEDLRFRSDKLSNLDLGFRLQRPGHALELQAVAFATRWQHIQSDYLLSNGLVGTRNVGNGSNFGLEATLRWPLASQWAVEGAATLQHARLSDPLVPAVDDPRLPVVPDVRLHGSVARSFGFGTWQGTLRTNVDYFGSSHLSFEQALDRRTAAFATVGAGLDLQHGGLAFALRVTNLLDSRADTYSFGNPFSVGSTEQHTPVRPRAVSLSIGWSMRP
jgi:outer membrane receptor protein involved in Fe transport